MKHIGAPTTAAKNCGRMCHYTKERWSLGSDKPEDFTRQTDAASLWGQRQPNAPTAVFAPGRAGRPCTADTTNETKPGRSRLGRRAIRLTAGNSPIKRTRAKRELGGLRLRAPGSKRLMATCGHRAWSGSWALQSRYDKCEQGQAALV